MGLFSKLGGKGTKEEPKAVKAQAMYDVIVIGGGPGGYLCAERAAQSGLSAAVFEERRIGGTCLNEGCIPTKTLLHSAKMYRHAVGSEVYGVKTGQVNYDQAAVIDRKCRVVDKLVSGLEYTMDAAGVTVIPSKAVIKGRENGVFAVTAAGTDYTADRLVIATGSEIAYPSTPGIKEGLESGFVLTSREILDLKEIPKRLVSIGAGIVGLELAVYFESVGSHVALFARSGKMAGKMDSDITAMLQAEYAALGMEFHLKSRILKVTGSSVVYEEDGAEHEIACDKVLLCAGRIPRIGEVGLEKLGIRTEHGAIVTDEHLCTNVPGVYAVGDVNGKMMLAHTAYREAEVAVHHMLGAADEMNYNSVATVLYTDPEAACVGESAQSARDKGMNVKEIRLPLLYSGRYVAENENGKGFMKLVVNTDTRCVVGCHIVGSYASEIIVSAAMMIDAGLPLEQLKKVPFPHPSVGEIIREALFMV